MLTWGELHTESMLALINSTYSNQPPMPVPHSSQSMFMICCVSSPHSSQSQAQRMEQDFSSILPEANPHSSSPPRWLVPNIPLLSVLLLLYLPTLLDPSTPPVLVLLILIFFLQDGAFLLQPPILACWSAHVVCNALYRICSSLHLSCNSCNLTPACYSS